VRTQVWLGAKVETDTFGQVADLHRCEPAALSRICL
jgi:hypothetical protein